MISSSSTRTAAAATPGTPGAPSSSTMASARATEFRWTNGRGQELLGVEHLPPGGAAAAKAALVWHHGVCEHSGRYAPVFDLMAARHGVAVYTFDAHGHGRSQPDGGGERCLVSRFDDLVDDAYAFVAAVEQRRGGRLEPCALGGQSMGGLVAAHAALRCQERWAGLVLHSAALGVVWTPLLRAQALVGNVLSALVPRAQLVPAVNPEDLHPEAAVVEAFRADPLIFHGPLRARTANEILRGMRALAPRAPEVTLPLYVVHGLRDATTSLEAVEDFVARAGSGEVEFKKVEGGYHELLMGSERDGNGGAVAEWVAARCAAWAAAKERARREERAPLNGASAAAQGGSASPKL